MTATTNIDQAETITNPTTAFDSQGNGNTLQGQEAQAETAGPAQGKGKAESKLRAAARRHGLTMKELAHLMGVNAGYLSDVANGRRPWTPFMREQVMAVLGEVPGQGIIYRQGGVITGESSYIRERAREKGLSMKDLAVVVGVSYGFMTQAARGHRNMSPHVQARVEAALDAPARVEPARCANRQGSIANGGSTFIRERARELGMSMGELADRVGGVSRLHVGRGPGPPELEPSHAGAGGGRAGRSPQGGGRQASHRRPASPVGPHGCPRVEPERDRPAGRHKLRSALPDHERQAHPVGGRAAEAPRGSVRA